MPAIDIHFQFSPTLCTNTGLHGNEDATTPLPTANGKIIHAHGTVNHFIEFIVQITGVHALNTDRVSNTFSN